MKKFLSTLLIAILCISMAFSFTACTDTNGGDGSSTPTADNGTSNDEGDSADNQPTPDNSGSSDPSTSTPDNNQGSTDPNAIKCEIWRIAEISLTSSKKYVATKGQQGRVVFDGVFKHKETGEVITRPGFWDGGESFKIRFAPTKTGVWEYETKCATDENLNGKKGTINVSAYTGNLELYKRGFVTTDKNKKYFTYADGTPFFYLGDTHWTLFSEEFDSAGDRAGNLKTNSHFKYIVDKRIEQGFTVYQSEPLNSKFDLTDGLIQRDDLAGLQDVDRYFKYIADKGLVHANAQFFFPTYGYIIGHDYEALDYLARYWVARFGAYPVMWTLAQEIDNDFYYGRGDQKWFNYQNNPWLKVAESMNKYDDYDHPLTGHQEGAGRTAVTGESTTVEDRTNGGRSIFVDEDVTKSTGHSWWGSQWGINFSTPQRLFEIAKEYWKSNKPAVIYEGNYCYLWTKDYGARAQGWMAYLNGCFGHGYGAIDIWSGRGDQKWFNYQNNPWLKVAESMNKYDDYDHPLTGHQEGAGRTAVTGESTTVEDRTNGGRSIFVDEDVTKSTGHSWWGSQWGINFSTPQRLFEIAKEYWKSNKPAVIYEGNYCYLWTKDYGARAQGWMAYLNGCFGHGYGAIDIWSYKSTYSMDKPTSDGRDIVSVEDKKKTWAEAVEFESAYQMGYMRKFFEQFSWWKLVPDFDTQKHFKSNVGYYYFCATIGNETYVLYLYNQLTDSGKLANMDNSATYTVKWFNPRTNEYKTIGTNIKPSGSTYTLPAKPDKNDWVVLATKN